MKKLRHSILFFFLGITISPAQNYAFDELDINNVRARFFANGGLFYDGSFPSLGSGFEVPKGSGKSTIFSSRLWIGGVDANGQLKLAAERYNQVGRDFFYGTLDNDSSGSCSIAYTDYFNHVWKINKSTIDTFLQVSNHTLNIPGYVIPDEILQWPSDVAPFVDVNGDGNYIPQIFGDYPKIRGDQALFFVFNDKCDLHTESGGEAIGVEIHGMAYAYNCPIDSALSNTVFVHYDIINRGPFTLTNTYIGLWSDMDIGFANDDFVGCDVMRGSYFTYNGVNVDHAPSQSVTFLAGPYQDENGIDDAFGIGLDESLNGFGFRDGITDNERLGLSNFSYFNNPGGSVESLARIYYNYLQTYQADGSPVLYNGFYNTPTKYMFPGNSDQEYFWGTNGVSVPFWSEETSGNVPHDRRGLGSSGPFTLEPGEVNPFDIAFVYGRDYDGNNIESTFVMKDRIDAIRAMFLADSTSCGGTFTSVKETETIKNKIVIFPNPANEIITVSCSAPAKEQLIELFNVNGQKVLSESLNNTSGKTEIDVNALSSGIYFIRISNRKEIIYVQKIIKN